MRQLIEKLGEKTKWLRSALITIILIAIIVLIYISINMWVESQNWVDIDLTKEKLYSLSDESKDKIKAVEKDTKIILYGMSNYQNVITFANLYSKENEHITYEELQDATARPDLQLEYGLGTTTSEAIIIETSTKKKFVSTSELSTYDYTTYTQIDSTEQAITNAILDVNLEKNPKIYFVTNHAEYASYYQIITEFLKNEANEVETLDLLVKGNVPEDCDVLVLTTIKEDYTNYETELITSYINAGGKMLILADPNYQKVSIPNFEKILDIYGVSISSGVIYEQDMSRTINGYPNIIIPTINGYSEITKYIASDGAVAFIDGGKINFKTDEELANIGVTVNNLIMASEKAFLRTDLTQVASTKTNKDEDAAQAVLGTHIIKQINEETKAEAVIYANSIFASDFTVNLQNQTSNSISQITGIGFYNNKDLLINTISYLTQRTDNVTIRKDTGVVPYTATQQEHVVIQAIIIALPVAVIVTGIVVWQIRRRKK